MKKTKLALAIAATAFVSTQAHATNGMNMEGYGPISTAMGGTAQAFNNGLGGMMNNPATMGMGSKEGNKFQAAIGKLGPDVNASMPANSINQDSMGTAYYMPGFGYATKKDGVTWGIGILGQGGMGTEYGRADVTGASGHLFAGGLSMMGANVPLSGEENRSELSVGRVIAPLNIEVNDKLTVGGSIDFVWAGMDIMMDMSGQQFGTLAAGGNVSGSMYTTLQGMMPAPVSDVNWARFDFSNNDDYTGQATGTGFGGKLGLTYKASNKLTLGASYHTKTAISDLNGDATLSMNVDMPAATTIPVVGEISVKDFQWPSTIGLGMAYQANDKWLFTADYKRINWSETMDKFRMVFTADAVQSGAAAGFAGQNIDVTLPQNWDDQNVVMLGTQYKYSDKLAVRAGLNLSSNPVPADMVNPLFPATVEKHVTLGFGYNFNKQSSFDFSLTHAPEANTTGSGSLNNGIQISHAQTNWQAMYTYKWGVKK